MKNIQIGDVVEHVALKTMWRIIGTSLNSHTNEFESFECQPVDDAEAEPMWFSPHLLRKM